MQIQSISIDGNTGDLQGGNSNRCIVDISFSCRMHGFSEEFQKNSERMHCKLNRYPEGEE